MPLFVSKASGILTIANGAQASTVFKWREVHEGAVAIILYARNATDGVLTYKIQVTDDPDAQAPTWYDLEDSTPAVIAAPNVTGKARVYTPSLQNWWGAAGGMRLLASAATTGIRSWDCTTQWTSA